MLNQEIGHWFPQFVRAAITNSDCQFQVLCFLRTMLLCIIFNLLLLVKSVPTVPIQLCSIIVLCSLPKDWQHWQLVGWSLQYVSDLIITSFDPQTLAESGSLWKENHPSPLPTQFDTHSYADFCSCLSYFFKPIRSTWGLGQGGCSKLLKILLHRYKENVQNHMKKVSSKSD